MAKAHRASFFVVARAASPGTPWTVRIVFPAENGYTVFFNQPFSAIFGFLRSGQMTDEHAQNPGRDEGSEDFAALLAEHDNA